MHLQLNAHLLLQIDKHNAKLVHGTLQLLLIWQISSLG